MNDWPSFLDTPSEEQRYRYMLEASSDMISAHTPYDWRYLAVNNAVQTVLGYVPEDLIGQSAMDYFHPNDADSLSHRDSELMRYRDGVYTYVYRIRHKEGHYVWVETARRSIRDPKSGELQEVICVTRDVTERVKAEQVTQRLARVMAASSDLILLCSPEAMVVEANPSALQVLGLEGQLPVSCQSWLREDSWLWLRDEVFPQAERDGRWGGEVLIQPLETQDRSLVLREVICHRLPNAAQDLEGYSLVLADKTRQMAAERAAQERLAQLTQISRVLSLAELSASLGHEINQPLGAVRNYCRGALRRLKRGQHVSAKTLSELFSRIDQQAQRMADIVERIRQVAKRQPSRRQVVDLNQLCRDTGAFFQRDYAPGKIQLSYALAEQALLAEVEPVQIEQILVNLLANARDVYRARSISPPNVCIQSARLDSGELCICVSDSAGGLRDTDTKALFTPFVSSRGGLGMGLSISRSIAEGHGGHLTVQDNANNGTTFTLTIPGNHEYNNNP